MGLFLQQIMTRAKKSLGQHFLTNQHTAQRIADAVSADVKTLIEVGPGPGILTDHLLAAGGEFIVH